MNRKKNLLQVLSLLLCVVLLAGCGSQEPEETTAPPNPYEALAGVYRSDLSVEGGMSIQMFLQIGQDGSFIFSRSDDFSSKEKGAGTLEKSQDGGDTFVYEIVRDEPVEKGANVSSFQVTEEGGIQFTSLMWFGSATPRFIAEDKTETYPVFLPYDGTEPEETTAPTESEETTQPSTEPETTESESAEAKPTEPKSTEPKATEPKATEPKATEPKATEPKATEPKATEPKPTESKPTEPAKPAFREDTYRGTLDKFVDAMQSNIHYDISLALSGGSYTYTVDITLSGKMSHQETQTYTGGYTVDGLNLTMTGTLRSGTVNSGGSVTVTGLLSSFASSADSVTLYS